MDQQTNGTAEEDAEQTTGRRQEDRFDQELPEDVAPRAPIALRTPISRVRSVTETIMIAITPMPPTSNAIDEIMTSARNAPVILFQDV